MLFRVLLFIVLIFLLFMPIYYLVNFLYKKLNIFQSDQLIDEYERNKNAKEQLVNEINDKIEKLEKEKEHLNKVKE